MTPVSRIPTEPPDDAARRAVAGLRLPYLKALETVVHELCLNVRQWAEAPGEVFVERDENQVSVTVKDEGLGIPATTRKAFPDLDDEGAVTRAFGSGRHRIRGPLARVRSA